MNIEDIELGKIYLAAGRSAREALVQPQIIVNDGVDCLTYWIRPARPQGAELMWLSYEIHRPATREEEKIFLLKTMK